MVAMGLCRLNSEIIVPWGLAVRPFSKKLGRLLRAATLVLRGVSNCLLTGAVARKTVLFSVYFWGAPRLCSGAETLPFATRGKSGLLPDVTTKGTGDLSPAQQSNAKAEFISTLRRTHLGHNRSASAEPLCPQRTGRPGGAWGIRHSKFRLRASRGAWRGHRG